MVGPNGVVAVLDWEVAHIGDPMRDLGWLCTNSWRFGPQRFAGGRASANTRICFRVTSRYPDRR
jgi:aminoglycoside phosphotransferase (APT) family kinase protein